MATKSLAPLRASFSGYALGFQIRDYRGRKLVTHTGGLPGYISPVAMIPDLKLGVAVLTHHESSAMEPIVFRILDFYLGASYDWRTAWRTVMARNDSMNAAQDAGTAAARNSTRGPLLPLARYAGTYTDPWYGDVVLALENGKLTMQFSHTPSLLGDLEHWQYDTFLVHWRDRELRADAFITFALNPDGSIERARMVPASPTVDFSFDFQDLSLTPKPPLP